MKPPDRIPADMIDGFTMGGVIPVEYKYRDDSADDVQQQISINYSRASFNRFRRMVRDGRVGYYKNTDRWLYKALSEHNIKDADVCIFGSASPWYEAMFLEHGADTIDVLEYSERESFDDRVKYIKEDELRTYDIAVSISSFEHYGLGRYGDPVDPNGDITAMSDVRGVLNNEGLLFLSIPIGKDAVYFNVHRTYGKIRFPLLTEGWNIVDSFGVTDNSFERTVNGFKGTPYQPVFVLKKKET